ncbi:hypothetical protein [Halorubrum halophilum]|uniref:hypothetical protein n=1 Tax=Halorubrum halophilum TaxID=413816 RepID=UPI0012AC2FEF|nr:hypothetical protein [Halorubrum halophilum]
MISELIPVTIEIHGRDTGVVSLDLREKCHVDEAAFLVEADGALTALHSRTSIRI